MDQFNKENLISSTREGDDALQIIDKRNITSLYAIDKSYEVDIPNMTSLGNYILLGQLTGHSSCEKDEYIQEDHKLQRLSLAYERLHSIPKLLLQEIASVTRILDISHNEFDNLDFLREFSNLKTLICDHNSITVNTRMPYMPKLELLWFNHCKIESMYPWAKRLQLSCPNLKYLSLMGNPGAPSYLNGGNFYEHLQYRLFIISLFPKLIHLDDRPVTSDQRNEAERVFHKPLVERLVEKTQTVLPTYLRQFSDTVSDIITPTPSSFVVRSERNLII